MNSHIAQKLVATYALIGPASLTELENSLGALDVELSPDEVAWLNLELPAAASTGRLTDTVLD